MPVTRAPSYEAVDYSADSYGGSVYGGKYGDEDRSFSTGYALHSCTQRADGHSSPMDRRETKKGAPVQSQAPPTQSIYDLIGEPNTSVNEVRNNSLSGA
jgi:hypothetical protein